MTPAAHLGGQARQDHDGELETLRTVKRHDANGVVIGLGQQRFVNPRAFATLQVGPGHERAEVSAPDIGEASSLVDEETNTTPRIARPSVYERQRVDIALTHHLFEQHGGFAPHGALMPSRQRHHRIADDTAGLPGRRRGAIVPTPTGLRPHKQAAVITGQDWTAQGRERGQLVGRIVDSRRDRQQVSDLRRVEHQRARVDPIRKVEFVESSFEKRQGLSRGDEHRDVGEPSRTPGADIGSLRMPHRPTGRISADRLDDGRDVGSLAGAQRRGIRIIGV